MTRSAPPPIGPSPASGPIPIASAPDAAALGLAADGTLVAPRVLRRSAAAANRLQRYRVPERRRAARTTVSRAEGGAVMFWQRRTRKLVTAIHDGDSATLKKLLKAGADPRARGPDGEPLLFAAVWTGNRDIVRRLLAAGADPNARSRSGETVLMRAIRPKMVQIVQLLLHRGADPNASDEFGNAPMHLAAYKGYVDLMEELQRAGADINRADVDGITPLMAAVMGNQAHAASHVLEAGAFPGFEDKQGDTPREMAVKQGHTSVVHVLDRFAPQAGPTPAPDPAFDAVLAGGEHCDRVYAGTPGHRPGFAVGVDHSALVAACAGNVVCEYTPRIEQQRIYSTGQRDRNGDLKVAFAGIAASCGATEQFGLTVAKQHGRAKPYRYVDLSHILACCCVNPQTCPFRGEAVAQRSAVEDGELQLRPSLSGVDHSASQEALAVALGTAETHQHA